jgi:hypothetical protein
MGLPWVRLDSNIASHDKIMSILREKEGTRAFTLYVCGLGYSGGHATDGFIPEIVLPAIHGTSRLAALLESHGLWEPVQQGWVIHNYAERQELAAVTEAKRSAQSRAGRKSQCVQRHGAECGCWSRG